jgi:hypothetical protein
MMETERQEEQASFMAREEAGSWRARRDRWLAVDLLSFWRSRPAWIGAVTPVTLVAAAVMVLGIFLRAKEYFSGRSLWVDEAMLSLSVVSRDFAGLLQPLDWDQAAPPGFLMMQRLAVEMLGNNEKALRLFPFIAGLLSLPLMYSASKRILGRRGAILALFLIVISPTAIQYSSEAKQYGFDLLSTVLVLHAATLYVAGGHRTATLIWIAFVGSVTPLFSHSVMLVTASVGGGLLVWEVVRQRVPSRGLLIAGGVIVAAALANFVFVLRPVLESKGPHPYWDRFFLSLRVDPDSEQVPFGQALLSVFDTPLGIEAAGLGAATFVLGLIVLIRRRELLWAASIVVPLVLVVLAALLEKYPFDIRFLLFASPLLALGVVAGIEGFLAASSRKYAVIGLLLFVFVIGDTARERFRSDGFWRPDSRQEMRPLLEQVQDRLEPDDLILVFGPSTASYQFYSKWVPEFEKLKAHPRVSGFNFETDFEQYRGESRVWLILTHLRSERREKLHELLQDLDQSGRRIDQRLEESAWAYLYDFSQ